MSRQGGVHFRDLEKHGQRQGGLYSDVCLGNCTSSMLLGCEVRVQDWQEDGGGNQITEGLMFMLKLWTSTGMLWGVIVVFLNRRRVPGLCFRKDSLVAVWGMNFRRAKQRQGDYSERRQGRIRPD